MWKKLINTDRDVAALVLRVALGIVFYFHGMAKLTTMYGGYGFAGTLGFFTSKMGIPAFFAVLAILAEGLGWAGLIAGFLTRVAAFGITVNMLVAVYMIHWQNGIFMNWFGVMKDGKPAGEGFEYHLLAIAIGIALMIKGGGALSVDRALAGKK